MSLGREPPRLREATKDDAPGIARLLAETMRDPWSEESVVLALGMSGSAALLAERDGMLAGALLMQVAADEVQVLQVAVAAPFRRQGLGTRLLREGLAWAVRRGATAAFLEVREGNAAARELYAREGFGEIGRRRAYYLDGEDALVLARSLRAGPPPT